MHTRIKEANWLHSSWLASRASSPTTCKVMHNLARLATPSIQSTILIHCKPSFHGLITHPFIRGTHHQEHIVSL